MVGTKQVGCREDAYSDNRTGHGYVKKYEYVVVDPSSPRGKTSLGLGGGGKVAFWLELRRHGRPVQ